mmetsp:Transcript_8004/g.17847  ORF Transcript_8004/g.17847 Transcript_8004/m.17847 type:complete len:201 (-) Transcript_8004:502-1104(-)
MSTTSGWYTSLASWPATAAASWSERGTCSSRRLRRCLRSSRGDCTCSTPSWRRSMASLDTHSKSTTARRRQWRRKACTTCTSSCSVRLLSSSDRPEPARSMSRPLSACHQRGSRMRACATPRWRRCSARLIVHVASTTTHPSSAIPGRLPTSGTPGDSLRSSTATRTPSETCSASSAACRRLTPKCTLTPRRSPRRSVRS